MKERVYCISVKGVKIHFSPFFASFSVNSVLAFHMRRWMDANVNVGHL